MSTPIIYKDAKDNWSNNFIHTSNLRILLLLGES